eukprot:CAMPEP_0176129726 /NCGR_PEP_ID=MMETSP0120_2-20121206/65612_1 /TAXON_ID=160619 /ORGANISM="Kryptoperidinium foliaceum, Strain CCMP 1326" /LENGTH=108 /DNA_ID=CAMNT_0017464957 /DNA_START=40 /DNA_END=362 /DNA_ORIENTATION=+
MTPTTLLGPHPAPPCDGCASAHSAACVVAPEGSEGVPRRSPSAALRRRQWGCAFLASWADDHSRGASAAATAVVPSHRRRCGCVGSSFLWVADCAGKCEHVAIAQELR